MTDVSSWNNLTISFDEEHFKLNVGDNKLRVSRKQGLLNEMEDLPKKIPLAPSTPDQQSLFYR